MEERLKLLEAKVDMCIQTMAQVDKVLGVIAQWMMVNKQFMDALQVNKQSEITKPGEVIK